MSVASFDDLMVHVGHEVVVTYYGSDDLLSTSAVNVAVECLDCNEVLLDFDKE